MTWWSYIIIVSEICWKLSLFPFIICNLSINFPKFNTVTINIFSKKYKIFECIISRLEEKSGTKFKFRCKSVQFLFSTRKLNSTYLEPKIKLQTYSSVFYEWAHKGCNGSIFFAKLRISVQKVAWNGQNREIWWIRQPFNISWPIFRLLQGVPIANCQVEMAVELKPRTSDPMFVKPKYVWEVIGIFYFLKICLQS